jgi:hypothetical protein
VLLLPFLVGCSGDTVTDTDTSPDPITWETCDDFRMVMSQAWAETDLPTRESTKGSWPGVAIGDFNGDELPDVLMAYGGGSALLVGDGSGWFVLDAGASLDGEPLPRARAVAATDIDSDGDLDAVLSPYNEGELQLLLRNDGSGRFTGEPLAGSGYITWSPVFGDLNGDGRLDLYMATYTALHDVEPILAGEAFGEGHAIYFQDADGSFVRDEAALPESIQIGLSLQGALLDVEGDGDLDIYMTNDFGPFVLPNRLLLNDGAGAFTVDEDCACDLSMYAMGTAVGDADGDGHPDLFVSTVGSPALLKNLGDGTFVDSTLASGAYIPPTEDNMTSWGTVFFDPNQDGCQDLVIVYGGLNADGQLVLDYESGGEWTEVDKQQDVLLLSDCAGGYTRAPAEVFQDTGRARAVAIGDLNQDGRPDVVIAGKHYLDVWLAEGGCEPGLALWLDAGFGNRQGIGARVEVDLGDRTVTQWMLPGTTASSSEAALWLGFGGRSRADSVTVTWPDGETERIADVAAGSVLRLVQ